MPYPSNSLHSLERTWNLVIRFCGIFIISYLMACSHAYSESATSNVDILSMIADDEALVKAYPVELAKERAEVAKEAERARVAKVAEQARVAKVAERDAIAKERVAEEKRAKVSNELEQTGVTEETEIPTISKEKVARISRYVTMQVDMLIPAEPSVAGNELMPNATYECIGKTSEGYLIVCANSKGKPCIGTLPWRDQMTHPTCVESNGTVTVKSMVRAKLSSGYIPLKKGESYRVMSETPSAYRVRLRSRSFTNEIPIAKNKVTPFVFAISLERLLQLNGSYVRLQTGDDTFYCKIVDIDDDSLLVKYGSEYMQDLKRRVFFIDIKDFVAAEEHDGRIYTPMDFRLEQQRKAAQGAYETERQSAARIEADQEAARKQAENNAARAKMDVEAATEQRTVQEIQTLAEHGDAEAQFKLGIRYVQGKGIEANFVKAEKWFSKAADQGHPKAICEIGRLYWLGKGVVKDTLMGCSYWMVASAFGDEEGKNGVEMCRDIFSPASFQEAQRRAHLLREAIVSRTANAESKKRSTLSAASGEPQLTGSGTGFIISQDGYLLTCNHVVQDSRTISVQLGGTKYPASIVKKDVANDLALLKIEGSGLATIPLQTDVASKGSKVFTVGFPNPELQGTESKYTDGTISSLSGIQDDIHMLQISVPVQSGNSGGALIDEDGNVVGIVVAKLNAVAALGYTGDLPQNVNYAIKVMYAMPLIQSVEGLQKRLQSSGKSANATATAEKATCMVMVYK